MYVVHMTKFILNTEMRERESDREKRKRQGKRERESKPIKRKTQTRWKKPKSICIVSKLGPNLASFSSMVKQYGYI